jgi:hypothetical protein
MNERIKEIATQANPNFTKSYVVGPWYAEDIEKFAELIVKECSYLADQAHHKATGGKSAGGYIRQHFGVEE